MNQVLLVDIIARSWSKETSYDPENWTEKNRAWGQCAVTALVVNDYLSGDIVWAEAALPDGRKISHYFNVVDGIEKDLTRAQFPEGTIIPKGVERKRDFPTTRDCMLSHEGTKQRYQILKRKVENLVLVSD